MSLYSAACRCSQDGVQLGIDSNNANSCEQDLGVRNARDVDRGIFRRSRKN